MLTRITLILTVSLLVRPAVAQDEADPERGLLAGPKLSDQEADGRGPTFSSEQRVNRRDALPPRRWLAIYQGLELLPEQQPQVQVVLAEWARDVKLFAKRNGREERELQLKFQAARTGRGPALTEVEQKRLRELADLKPVFEPYQSRLWELLTPQQQGEFQRLYEEDVARDRARRLRRQAGGGAPAAAPEPMEPDQVDAPEERPGYDEAARRRLEFLRSLQKAPRRG
jgi:hypothetical protein